MPNFNRRVLVGNLTTTPEIRVRESGKNETLPRVRRSRRGV